LDRRKDLSEKIWEKGPLRKTGKESGESHREKKAQTKKRRAATRKKKKNTMAREKRGGAPGAVPAPEHEANYRFGEKAHVTPKKRGEGRIKKGGLPKKIQMPGLKSQVSESLLGKRDWGVGRGGKF